MNTMQRFLYFLLAVLFLISILLFPVLTACASDGSDDQIKHISDEPIYKPLRNHRKIPVRAALLPHATTEKIINYLWLNGWTYSYTNVELMDQIISECVSIAAGYRNLDPYFLLAVIAKESNFKPDTIGDNGKSFGLMQIQPQWHSERAERLGVSDYCDIHGNILLGADYLSEIMVQLHGSHLFSLVGYNAGPAAGARAMEERRPSDYAARVFRLYMALGEIGGLRG